MRCIGVTAATFAILANSADGARLTRKSRNTNMASCGVKGNEVQTSIVNGDDAPECAWRWQVNMWRPSWSVPFCGGTLITPEWVLTAAHCASTSNFYVKAGDWETEKDSGNEQRREVFFYTRHPLYDNRTFSYDYALARLQSPMDINDCVGTVCLPEAGNDVAPGTECWITGWGTLSSGGRTPRFLQEGRVNTISNQACVNDFGYSSSQITGDEMLCAQGRNSNGTVTDACQGDSGGPLVCKTGDAYTLYGVTSWGEGCAARNFPGVWARVHQVLDWIQETMDANSDPIPEPEPNCPGFCTVCFLSACRECPFC